MTAMAKFKTGKKDFKSTEKRGRLIVRNLSFKTTDDKLTDYFQQFGEVIEVKLLRRPDNTLVGCGFVQMKTRLSAAKAIHHLSGKPFLGRPIIVDWALSKDRYTKIQEESLTKEIKKESVDEKVFAPMDISNVSVKKEEVSDEEPEEDSESEEESEESDTNEEQDEDDESDDVDEDDDDDDDDDNDDGDGFDSPEVKKEHKDRRQTVEDVDEGKTVFLKNLPYSVNDVKLKVCMEQFGPVLYAVVCTNKLTEHSIGSAFVKFKNKEDADKCLSAGTELKINGVTLDPHPALKKSEAEKLRDKTREKRDNRNLYLTKEGLIIAGTPSAKGVSMTDMKKRLQLEQWKTAKLHNLNMFVSNNRLVVHNLPEQLNDKQLRKLFLKNAGPKAVIKEAKIMRNWKNVDDKGQGVSKGYGFVTFEKHEDALIALRKINNNPKIFTPSARPIVAFSIENRVILNMKKTRLERSKKNNPLCKEYKGDGNEDDIPAKKLKQGHDVKQQESTEPQYAGLKSKPGGSTKIRMKHKLKNQAEQHMQSIKQEKRKNKNSKRQAEHVKKKQVEKKMKTSKQVGDNDESFTRLVDKYRTKILTQTKEKKRWYDE